MGVKKIQPQEINQQSSIILPLAAETHRAIFSIPHPPDTRGPARNLRIHQAWNNGQARVKDVSATTEASEQPLLVT